MVTYEEVESLVKTLSETNEIPIRCLEQLRHVESRIAREGADNPRLLGAVRRMKETCASEVLIGRREMLDWLDKNYDRIKKRQIARSRDKARGVVDIFENMS